MKTYTNSSGISITISPFFDSGYSFDYLQMKEEIGGTLAYGELGLILDGSDTALKLVEEQHAGHITLEREGGNIYEIDFFITERSFNDNYYSFTFLCVPKREFYTDLKITTWDDLGGAISSLYPGKQDIRCESDVTNGTQFFQQRETDYDFCRRLCYSFKYDIVFAFGFEGLMLKETISKDHTGQQEPFYIIWGDQEVEQIGGYRFKYDKLLYEAPLNPWEPLDEEKESLPDRTSLESLNCCCMRTYDEYKIIGRGHYTAIENRRYNERYLNSDLWTKIVTVDENMPLWKIGDVIKYGRRKQYSDQVEVPFDTYIVSSNEIFFACEGGRHTDYSGKVFSWTTTFLGLQTSHGEEQPRTDPTNNKEE